MSRARGTVNVRPLLLLLAIALPFSGGVSLAEVDGTISWSVAENLSDIPGRSTYATLATDPVTGDTFVVWMDEGVAERAEIMGRRWDATVEAWQPALSQPAENLSLSEWHDGGPVPYFDRFGNGLLLWTRRYSASQGAPESGTDLMWRSWEGTGWSGEHVLLHSDSYLPSTYGYGLIPVETADAVQLFITWDTNYRTTEYRNDTWSEPSPWNSLDVELAQVIRDESGLLHAAAYGENSSQKGNDVWFHDAYYLMYDGTAWTEPVNLSSTRGVVRDVGLALDGLGRLHFLWSDSDSIYSSESLKSAIWERISDGDSWTPNTEVTVDNENQAINGFSLTTGAHGTLHLAWSEGIFVDNGHANLGIYYRTGSGITWRPEETVYTSTVESRYPVLAVGDNASLIWQEGPASECDVFFSQKVGVPPESHQIYLPWISR